jgi:hypothetical protein
VTDGFAVARARVQGTDTRCASFGDGIAPPGSKWRSLAVLHPPESCTALTFHFDERLRERSYALAIGGIAPAITM